MKIKVFFPKLKDFSSKLKVSEILLCFKPQNQGKKPALQTVPYLEMQIFSRLWISDSYIK